MTAPTPGVLQSGDGAQIATYTWLPPEGRRPRAFLQLVHGAAEHARRYERFATHLTARGYAVLASDHRGHGATAPSTGGYGVTGTDEGTEADGWLAILADLKAVGDQARALYPEVPVLMLGHSLGSMLAREYVQEYPDDLTGLLLTGVFRSLPGAEYASSTARLEEEIAAHGRAFVSDFVPRLFASFNDGFAHRTGFEWLSRDEAEVDAYVADERCGFPFSAGLAYDWVRAAYRVNDPASLARMPRDLPVHLAAGTLDPCNQRMTLVNELLDDYRYHGVSDLTWTGYEGARHEILNETEPDRSRVYEDLTAWLDAHTL
ncbi:alpha/beta fold hydrolase [Streptomyces sp. NPDC088674]|uniref:alpha/beta fold hydrolase n=1 Tax=Streptomyces sp. NPDC088674 TaxID=3365869 RepID=UPI003810537E